MCIDVTYLQHREIYIHSKIPTWRNMYVDRLICIMFVSHQEYKMAKGTVNLGFLQGIVDSDPKNIGKNGKDVVVFTLKTYSSFGNQGEDKAMRHEIHVTDQNNSLYALQFIRKNMMVMIQGYINNKFFKDRNNNWQQKSTFVNAYNYPIMIMESDAVFREPPKPTGDANGQQNRYVQQNYTHAPQQHYQQPQPQYQQQQPYPQQQMQQQPYGQQQAPQYQYQQQHYQQPQPQYQQQQPYPQQQMQQQPYGQQQAPQQGQPNVPSEIDPPPYDDPLEF